MSDIEGKAAREAVSEGGQRANFNRVVGEGGSFDLCALSQRYTESERLRIRINVYVYEKHVVIRIRAGERESNPARTGTNAALFRRAYMGAALKILAVDNEPSVTLSLRYVFPGPRYELTDAENGIDALARLDADSFGKPFDVGQLRLAVDCLAA